MSEYSDIKIINCNRSSSVESRSGNNDNPAVFTNPLQQTIKLDVGDKVSVERAFISEVGAGKADTIEFKGEVKGSNIVPPYTDIQKSEYYYQKQQHFNPNYRLGYYRKKLTTIKNNEVVDLRDNLVPLIIGYYITSNEYPNYIQHPRRFSQGDYTRVQPNKDTSNHFTRKDSPTDGMCEFSVNGNIYIDKDWTQQTNASGNLYFKQRCDNTRFTLFIFDEIIYSRDLILDSAPVVRMFPQDSVNGIFSERRYLRVRERIDLEVNKGFNTPASVAQSLTQQLTETKTPINFQIRDGTGYDRTITKLIESTTYKPINCQNLFDFNETTYDRFIETIHSNRATLLQDELDYINSFGYIGIKRPEIYEAGLDMMEKLVPFAFVVKNSIAESISEWFEEKYYKGLQTLFELPNTDPPTRYYETDETFPVVLNVEYTLENLKTIKKFLDTQKLYPEIWDSFKNSADFADGLIDLTNPLVEAYPTIKNSRFFHMNKYTSQTDNVNIPFQGQLGEDNFKQESGVQNVNKASGIIVFEYDESTENEFISGQDYNYLTDGLMMGFARPAIIDRRETPTSPLVRKYYIRLSINKIGGIPASLFTTPFNNGVADFKMIERNRRIGYDLHATAYTTAIITPFSGYSQSDIGAQNRIKNSSGHDANPEQSFTSPILQDTTSSTSGIDLTPYKTMTYVGANNPAFDYNGTSNRFEIRRLHTGNNIGNRFMAGSKLTSLNNESIVALGTFNNLVPPEVNSDAGDSVYKINPRPPQFGYSPTFKPYTRFNQDYVLGTIPKSADNVNGNTTNAGLNKNNIEKHNSNIEPYEIFDSHGGIYIDNWGLSEKNWNNNLWDILGFSYEEVVAPPSSKNVLTRRVDNENNNLLYRPTTNAEIVSTDSKIYVGNIYNANMYYTSVPFPNNVITYETYLSYTSGSGDSAVNHYAFRPKGTIGTPIPHFPEISIKTQSNAIIASNIQKAVLKPYYEVRSSLLEGFTALGGNPTGAQLPIISVVDKYSAANDYFMGNPSNLIFTITKPSVISDITTSIHDSDGEYANIDERSAVIYKIQKIRKTPQSIIEEIMENNKDEKKKKK